MKRLAIVAAALVLILVLSACSGDLVNSVYTAAGDGSSPNDLRKTDTFRADEDLNVVVTLNSHTRSLPVYAIFNAPDGAAYSTDALEADATVGKVLLGLDWEAQSSTSWPTGEWSVDIYIDNNREKSVPFTVEPVEVPADS